MFAALIAFLVYAVYLARQTDRFMEKISSNPAQRGTLFEKDAAEASPLPTPSVRPSLIAKSQTLLSPLSRKQEAVIEPKPAALSFLVLGIDYRKQTKSMNTDVIMAVTISPDGKSATIVSLPRDMQLKPKSLPARKANYYFPYYYSRDRATSFEQTKQLFSQTFGVPLHHTVVFNFKGFEQIVDQLGGVNVDVDMNMRYVDREDGTDINLKKGNQTLNGKQALDFVRYRKSNRNTKESSDYMRNRRQQQVLHQLADKVTSFGGIMRLGELLNTAGDHIRTDIPADNIRKVMEAMLKVDRSQIQFIALQGDWRSPYIVVKDEALNEARLALQRRFQGIAAMPVPSPSPVPYPQAK